MLADLIVIIIIIVLSSVLCFVNVNTNAIKDTRYKCIGTHILIGLSVMIYYKVRNYFNLQTLKSTPQLTLQPIHEPFDQLPDSINSFIMGNSVNRPSANDMKTMSNTASQQYLAKLDSLVNAIDSLRKDSQTTTNNLQSTNNSTADRLNLESMQQFQNFQIQYLQNQINKTKELINSQQMTESSKKYKPIKVYSSCVVSNADGTTSTDIPVNNSNGNSNGSATNLNDSTTQQMLSSISQSSSSNQGPSLLQHQQKQQQSNNLNLASSTGALGNLLNSALNSQGVNINIT
jgi:hypothetical protein